MTKDTTIKLRLTAEEKANWEAQAEADGTTLSSLIRRRMNHPTTRADGVLEAAPKPTYGWGGGVDAQNAALARKESPQATPLLVRSSRDTTCEHGRPQYVFCPTCDA